MESSLISVADRALLQKIFAKGFLSCEEAVALYKSFLEVLEKEGAVVSNPVAALEELCNAEALVTRLNERLAALDFSVRLTLNSSGEAHLALCNSRSDRATRGATHQPPAALALFKKIVKDRFLNTETQVHEEGQIALSDCRQLTEDLRTHLMSPEAEAEQLIESLIDGGWLEKTSNPSAKNSDRTPTCFVPGVRAFAELKELDAWRIQRLNVE
jgi:hypothetical protein